MLKSLLLFFTHTLLVVAMIFLSEGASLAQQSLYASHFPLGDVVLLDGPFKHAQDLNIETLLKYDVERLVPYRKQSGLPALAEGYGNWEGLDGHVGGHYLSALSMHYM